MTKPDHPHAAVIDVLGTDDFCAVLQRAPSTVMHWRKRGIPAAYWHLCVVLAAMRGVTIGVDGLAATASEGEKPPTVTEAIRRYTQIVAKELVDAAAHQMAAEILSREAGEIAQRLTLDFSGHAMAPAAHSARPASTRTKRKRVRSNGEERDGQEGQLGAA